MNESAMCFWHPVGAHAGESLGEIVARKRAEIAEHGHTLWSFAKATRERVDIWRRELGGHGQVHCAVLCCGGRGARDPLPSGSEPRWAAQSSNDLAFWSPVPPRMTSYTRPAGRDGVMASAFVVEEIRTLSPARRASRMTPWLRADGNWERKLAVPTRGQYLVEVPPDDERGTEVPMLLLLTTPFVVWIR